ncbi:MAG: 8-oxo-dGTP diphosphatase MutT [Verrucomicrobiota bacterium]
MPNERQSAPTQKEATDPSPNGSHCVEVAAGIVFRDGKILITQRPSQDHLGDLWEFPGGKREAEESFEDCLQRELREELAIEVAVGELVDTVTHQYPEKTVHLKFYRCAWVRNEPQAIGCQAFAWVATPQLADYSFPAADTRLLEKLRKSLTIAG